MTGCRSEHQNINLLAVISAIFLLTVNKASSKNKSIHILSLLPFSDQQLQLTTTRSDGPVISMALELAQEQINSQTELLPDHRIELIQDDSGCEYTTGTNRAYEAFVRNIQFHREKLIGIIGPDCSSSALAIAPLLNHKEISLVALHGGESSLLSNRTLYPYTLGVLDSGETFLTLATKLIQQANWTRVGVLLDESQLLLKVENIVDIRHQVMDHLNITVSILSVTPQNDPLSLIVSEGLRVNFLFTSVATTQRVMCMAKYRKMIFSNYQWIVISHFPDDISQKVQYSTYHNDSKHICSEHDMRQFALNGVLFLNTRLSPLNESAPATYTKLPFNDYRQQLYNKVSEYNSKYGYNITYSPRNTYYYDSLWAWAVALDRLTRQNLSVDPTSYDSDKRVLSDLILAEFYALDYEFDEVSGEVKFNNRSGFLTRAVAITQYEGAELKLVATFDGKELVQYLNIAFIPDSFPDKMFGINDGEAIVFGLITAIELAVIVTLHILTIKYRDSPAVKASSYKLNQLVYLGCYLLIIAIFITISTVYPSGFIEVDILCTIQWIWLFPVSFTLVFGTLSVKTWRLYRIFSHYLNPSKFLENYHLVGIVLGLILIDAIIGIIWTSLDPFHIVLRSHTITDGVIKFLVVQKSCTIENFGVWYGIAYGYRVLLLVVTVILVVLTYKIPNPSFSTKTLRILIFMFTTVIVSGFSVFYISVFNSTDPTLIGWFALMITLSLIVVLCIGLLFTPPLIPKLKELRKNFTFPCLWKIEV